MKRLQDFINESIINESEDSKSITFNFTDLENAEDTLKSFEEMEYCTVDDNKLTVNVTSDNFDKLSSVQDILQQYAYTLRKSTKNSSDEQYAQKTKKFAETVAKFNNTIDEFSEPEEQNDDEKNKEKKEEE